jgi:methyl-accepting chemotaxis protein
VSRRYITLSERLASPANGDLFESGAGQPLIREAPANRTKDMMNPFRNSTIATRLVLAFGFVIAILAGQSTMGFLGAVRSQALLRTTVAEARTSYDLAVQLVDAVAAEDLHLRQMGLTLDARRVDLEKETIRRAGAEIDRLGRQLLQHTAGEDRQLVERFLAIDAKARPKLGQAIALYATMQIDQGNELVDKDIAPASEQRRALSAELSKVQQRRVDEAFVTIAALADQARISTVASALVGCLAALGAGVLLYRSITRPLNRAINIADSVASGDLTQRIDATCNDEIGQLLSALGRMSERMRDTLGRVSEATGSLHSASGEIASGNSDLSVRTERQAASLQRASASVADLASGLQRNAQASEEACSLADRAANVAQEGGTRVNGIVSTMNDIAHSSRRMSDIVGVIDGIAFQTNILALNAAVEAARAGEQGRGFAVVASEVRTLAQRSAAAAREIKQLIATNEATVESGVGQVQGAGGTIQDVMASAKRVSSMVAEISAAVVTQANSVRDIEGAVAAVDEGVQQNSALVEQSAAAAESLNAQAGALADAMKTFRLVN